MLLFLDCSCTSVHVSLHHCDDENEANSGRRTTDSEAKSVPLAQQGGGKAATPHRFVSVSLSFKLFPSSVISLKCTSQVIIISLDVTCIPSLTLNSNHY